MLTEVATTEVRRSAVDIAKSLGAWQLMDIVLVDRKGSMVTGELKPAGQTGRLIDLGVLKRARAFDDFGRSCWSLVPGPKFGAVKQAVTDLAKARSAEAPKP